MRLTASFLSQVSRAGMRIELRNEPEEEFDPAGDAPLDFRPSSGSRHQVPAGFTFVQRDAVHMDLFASERGRLAQFDGVRGDAPSEPGAPACGAGHRLRSRHGLLSGESPPSCRATTIDAAATHPVLTPSAPPAASRGRR